MKFPLTGLSFVASKAIAREDTMIQLKSKSSYITLKRGYLLKIDNGGTRKEILVVSGMPRTRIKGSRRARISTCPVIRGYGRWSAKRWDRWTQVFLIGNLPAR